MKYLAGFLKQEDMPAYIFKKGDEECKLINAYIDDLIKHYNSTEIEYDYYISGIISMIISMLYKKNILNNTYKAIDTKLFSKIEPVFDYIHKNYGECLNLEVLSKILNLNQQYFCRLFKRVCGTNVTDYVNFVRIQKAENLLKTNMNISEIAESTGFSSLSYFNKTFKKYKNYSPREYKKLNVHNNINH